MKGYNIGNRYNIGIRNPSYRFWPDTAPPVDLPLTQILWDTAPPVDLPSPKSCGMLLRQLIFPHPNPVGYRSVG
ncbi:MAG: hypothetical protein HXX20_24405 [Chloroflexi bacterium]|nr:hypothetical protein [Chloroflexota bacterium]